VPYYVGQGSAPCHRCCAPRYQGAGPEARGSNVSVYQDEVYIASTSGITFGMFDMDRIEVLRGPQGTLFGRNSTGGLVQFVSKRPTEDFEGILKLDVGSYGTVRMEGALSGPLGDSWSGRLSVLSDRNSGWMENTTGPENNKTRAYGVRAQDLWEPTDGAEVLFRAHWGENNPNVGAVSDPVPGYVNPATGLAEVIPPGVNAWGTCPGCDRAGNLHNDGDPFKGARNDCGDLFVARYGGGVTVSWDLGIATLASITDYMTVNKDYREDSDGGPTQGLSQFSLTDMDQFQQELRLSGSSDSVDWVAGIFYFDVKGDSQFAIDFVKSTIFPANSTFVQSGFAKSHRESWAAFGQLEYRFADRWAVTGGLRYYEERQPFETVYARDSVAGVRTVLQTFNRATSGELANQKYDGVGIKAQLDYRPSDDALWYLSFNRGVRPGFYQAGAFAINPVTLTPYKDETLDAYELGSKLDLAGGRLRLNTAAWYYDYKDMQTRTFQGFASATFNVDAELYGLDVELTLKPSELLELGLSASVIEGKAKNIQFDAGPNRGRARDVDVPMAPPSSANAYVKLQKTLGGGGTASALVNANYRAAYFTDIQNYPLQKNPASTVANLRFGYTAPSGAWTGGVYVNNVLDEEYTQFIGYVGAVGNAARFMGRPRCLLD
jgi:iron complex outermembrane receptor protein